MKSRGHRAKIKKKDGKDKKSQDHEAFNFTVAPDAWKIAYAAAD